MKHTQTTFALAAAFLGASVATAEVDFDLDPDTQIIPAGAIADIHIVVSSDAAEAQPFDALDAIFTWDPDVLGFLGADQSDAGATFFMTGFFPDADGINDDLADGDALFTALVDPGETVDAPPPPDELIVTRLRFETLQATTSTHVTFVPGMGEFGLTRALLGGQDVTGDASGMATVVAIEIVLCPWDLDGNGIVGFGDLLTLLEAWGPNPGHEADFDEDGVVGFTDLLKLLSAWGPCI